MRDRIRLLLVGLLLSSAAQAQFKAVVPAQASPAANRFYSPGVDAGDYVYVSGQGPRRPDGTMPATFAAQVQQALDNIKSVVAAAGLTMEHVVYTQVYMEDISKYGEMNRVFARAFPKTPPARAVLGVAKLPDTSIQINAVAVRDLALFFDLDVADGKEDRAGGVQAGVQEGEIGESHRSPVMEEFVH